MPLELPQLRESPSGQPLSETGGGGVVAYMCLDLADDSVVFPSAATINTMLGLTEPIAAFSLSADSRFALGANGVVTYTGPSLEVLVECTASLFTTGMTGYAHLGIALNNDLVGEAATNNNIDLVRAGCAMQHTGAGDSVSMLVARRLLTLATGNTLRPVAGTQNSAGASDLFVSYFTLTVEEVAI